MSQKFYKKSTKMTSNSRQKKNLEHKNAKNSFFKRICRKCRLIYKSVLNKTVTIHKKCIKFNFVAPLRRSKCECKMRNFDFIFY